MESNKQHKSDLNKTFNLLTSGICFDKTQKMHQSQSPEIKLNPSQSNLDMSNGACSLIFPDLTKEKEEIKALKRSIVKLSQNKTMPVSSLEKKIRNLKEKYLDLTNHFYTKLNLTSSASNDELNPLVSFQEMQTECKLRKVFSSIMHNEYKFRSPSPIQSVIIPLLISYKNTIASSETGSGKTLAYLIPSIHNSLLNKLKSKPNKIIIILPTKELAKQIYNESLIYCKYYTDNQLKVKYVNKGMILSIQNDHKTFLNNNDLYIATPKNIQNLLSICKDDLISQMRYIILDEADKFFDMGFIEIIDDILYQLKDKTHITKAFFSATLLEEIGEIITYHIFDSIKVSIGAANIPAKSIKQKFVYCTNEDGKLIGIRNVFKDKIEFPMLIFVEGIQKLKAIYEAVQYEIPKISLLHSKMSKKEREEQITKFRLGETWILICSDLLARGVDFKNVKTVVNYDCPYRPVNYIHRIGRTGRAGKVGKAITFVIDDDVSKLRHISKMLNQIKKNIDCPNWLLKLSHDSTNGENSYNNNKDKSNDR